MNLLLLEPEELDAAGVAHVSGRRAEHVHRVLGKGVGDTVRVGVVGGTLGVGAIEACSSAELVLRCAVAERPPPKRALTLVLALPRPPMLRRSLQQATAMGVGRIVLLHTARVDKSYWGSSALAPPAVRTQLLLGLEQAVDTVLPAVEQAPRFRPFAEDRLPELLADSTGLVADPEATAICPADAPGAVTLVVGPEGGFVDFERQQLAAAGCEAVSLGTRVLRVETAVVALLGRLGLG